MAKKAFSRPPNKKANKELGGLPLRKKAPSNTQSMEPGMGNVETGFLPRTKKAANAAMMGRAMPKMPKSSKSSTSAPGRKQFKKAGGKKVF